MPLCSDIARRIEAVIREDFANAVDSVDVVEAIDHAQDRILEVTVVIDRSGNLDPRKTAAIVRRIRSGLGEASYDAPFPILTFVSKADAASLKPEAA